MAHKIFNTPIILIKSDSKRKVKTYIWLFSSLVSASEMQDLTYQIKMKVSCGPD